MKIVPFPGQLRERVTTPPAKKPAAPPSIKPMQQHPEPKVMSAPSGRLHSSGVSIKKLLNPDNSGNAARHTDMSNMPMNDFSMDDLKMAWRQYAFQLKEAGNRTFQNALTKRDPILVEGTKYKLVVDNQTQIDSIQPIISELIDYIRATLKNYSVDVAIELNANPEEETKYLNGKDKFAVLARKNPNLHTLKSTFNLDIEF